MNDYKKHDTERISPTDGYQAIEHQPYRERELQSDNRHFTADSGRSGQNASY